MTTPPVNPGLRSLLLGLALLVAGSFTGSTLADARTDESAFISAALSNSQEQLARAQQALRYGKTLAVRDQAQGVLDEHTAMLRDLQTLAQKKGVPARSDAPLKPENSQAPLSASERFDHDYAVAQQQSSKAAVKAFDRMSKDDTDADLQGFARLWLPMLYHQRELADQLVASQAP
jgi:predicted outer membrane protein